MIQYLTHYFPCALSVVKPSLSFLAYCILCGSSHSMLSLCPPSLGAFLLSPSGNATWVLHCSLGCFPWEKAEAVLPETIPQHATYPSINFTTFPEAAFVACYQACCQELFFVGLTWLGIISYQLEGLPCVIPSPPGPQFFLWTMNPGFGMCKIKIYWLRTIYNQWNLAPW